MNTKSLFAVAAFATIASGAFAQQADPVGQFAQPVTASQTRADVQADLAAYKKAGVNPWSMSYNPIARFQSTTTRAQVQAGYLADRDVVEAMNGEDSGSAYLSQFANVRYQGSTNLAGTPVNGQ